jgi:predicted nuclease with TOPRIM domain
LITVILKGGIDTIVRANEKREQESLLARAAEVEAEIKAEEDDLTAVAEEAARLAGEAQAKLDEIRRRKAALEDKRATLAAAAAPA